MITKIKNENACTCDHCRQGDYDPARYIISEEEFQKLDQPRPFGLSGHMVVKNEALTLKESVESILPVLDELIITYQTSRDQTEEILMRLKEQYPDKLRVYHYKPWLPPYGRLADREESNRYPEGSIHNPANYYNFGLVKHRFAYYMKADGDQVYFTEKLQKIKDELQAIHEQPARKRSKLFRKSSKALLLINGYVNRYTPFHLLSLNSTRYRQLFATACFPGFAFSMAGVNVFFDHEELVVPVEPLDYNSGVGDHFILPAHSKTTYHWSENKMYEYFSVPKFIQIGFCWLHFKYIKTILDGQDRGFAGKAVSLQKCRNLTVQAMLDSATSDEGNRLRKQVRTFLLKHFWKQDRQYIRELPELTQKVNKFLKQHSQ